MKKILLFVLLMFAVSTSAVYAQAKDIKRLPPDEVTTNDYYSFAERVEVLGTVNGDLYTAGEEVFMGGIVSGDMLVAGGDIRVSGIVNGDLRAVGGKILVDGIVEGNITSGGGTIEIAQGAQVNGNLVAGAGEIIVAGPVAGDLTAAAGTIFISSVISGNTQLRAENISVSSGSQLLGNLTYWSSNDVNVDQGASVSGSINQNKTEKQNRYAWKQGFEDAKDGVNVFSQLVSIFTTSVIGFILLKYFPRYTDRGVQTILKKPQRSFVIGLLSLIAIPFITLLLLITVIGFPLAFGFAVLSMLYLYMSRVIGIYAVGAFLTKKANFKKLSTMYIFLLGLLCYYALSLIPVIGDIIKLVIILVSFGGALINEKKTYKLSKKLGAY